MDEGSGNKVHHDSGYSMLLLSLAHGYSRDVAALIPGSFPFESVLEKSR
jgi:hypothetical protein